MEEKEFCFEKLIVYKESRKLVSQVYKLLRKYPKEEQYALCDQLRRAVVSVPSNIAEGMSRKSSKEQLHFLEISYGSLMETYCQMEISLDLGYIQFEEFKSIKSRFFGVSKLLLALHYAIEHRM
jgi:four helix bundle protein